QALTGRLRIFKKIAGMDVDSIAVQRTESNVAAMLESQPVGHGRLALVEKNCRGRLAPRQGRTMPPGRP
ncbi:MAG TPA: hypothetical protein VFV17_10570, partial [Usitatibacteraceae bacterium]|nr:hypothetical protein [Usitatibacteraceae bacterium]